MCWFYAKYLYDIFGIPIGLGQIFRDLFWIQVEVSSNWGGTKIQSWSSHEALIECGMPTNASDSSNLWNAMIVPILPMRTKGTLNLILNFNLKRNSSWRSDMVSSFCEFGRTEILRMCFPSDDQRLEKEFQFISWRFCLLFWASCSIWRWSKSSTGFLIHFLWFLVESGTKCRIEITLRWICELCRLGWHRFTLWIHSSKKQGTFSSLLIFTSFCSTNSKRWVKDWD